MIARLVLLALACLVSVCLGSEQTSMLRPVENSNSFAVLIGDESHGRELVSCSTDSFCAANTFCPSSSEIPECIGGQCLCGGDAFTTYLIVVGVFAALSLILMCVVIKNLQNKEAALPPHLKVMNGGTICVIILLTFCLGLIGLLIGYCIFNSQIQNNLMMNGGAGGAPVAVVAAR